MRLLVTGGAGFIGSCFIKHIMSKFPEYKITNFDLLTYAGNLKNLSDIENNKNYLFVKGDICDPVIVDKLVSKTDCIVNFAAESHVDRSIDSSEIFIKTNVLGTHTLLEAARKNKITRYVQISTDEVYGSLGKTGLFTEQTPLAPNSPYSASKASADLLVRAYFETYKLPALITRCSNNYGPYQFPEKLIPLFIDNLTNDIPVPVYGDGMNIRDWLYVYDHCSAIDAVIHKGIPGEVYNIGGNNEKPNIEITKLLIKTLGKNESLIKYVEDRLGHDRRYAIDSSKIMKELGWKPSVTFEEGIKKTIDWYLANKNWVEQVKSKGGK